MKAKACLRLNSDSAKHLGVISNALVPETGDLNDKGLGVFLETQGTLLFLRIVAKDTITLRATLNTYLRWIHCLLNVLQVLETY